MLGISRWRLLKKDAIGYAWELLTSPSVQHSETEDVRNDLPRRERRRARSEAYDLWLGQQVPKDRIYEFAPETILADGRHRPLRPM